LVLRVEYMSDSVRPSPDLLPFSAWANACRAPSTSPGFARFPKQPCRIDERARAQGTLEIAGRRLGVPVAAQRAGGGKRQGEDVTDVELSLILTQLGSPVSDDVGGPGDDRKLTTYFPYLGTPFAGDAEGKGKPAGVLTLGVFPNMSTPTIPCGVIDMDSLGRDCGG
jgi:hypothetical protein